jgi:protein gp37
VAEQTGIEWCDHTFNPWRGCAEVSPGCANCYAREFAKRNPSVLGEWGEGSARPGASRNYFRQPLVWNVKAAADLQRRRVFCGSMMDFFEDRPDVVGLRRSTVRMMIETEDWLDWLLVTKRPQNVERLWPTGVGLGHIGPAAVRGDISQYRNAWLGVTVEDQKRADERIPILCNIPAYVRFLSIEPLLEEVDIAKHLHPGTGGVSWVIVGGESRQAGRCRRTWVEWVESVVVQCQQLKIPVFVKQLGDDVYQNDGQQRLKLKLKGKDTDEWPEHLRLRQFPEVA